MVMLRLVVLSVVALLTQVPPPRPAAPPGQSVVVSPEADRLLRRMSDFLGQQKEFSVKVDGTTEAILNSGQKVQVHSAGMVYVKRPGQLRIDKTGDDGGSEIFCDGKTFTFYSQPQNAYLTLPAGNTLDATLANVEAGGVIEMPGADLLYRDAYRGLMDDVIAGESLGASLVDGVPTHHLVFRGREVDWQIWIEDGARPVPRKYVITSKKIEGSPEYEIVMTNWKLDSALHDPMFKFQPPAGAQPIPQRGATR